MSELVVPEAGSTQLATDHIDELGIVDPQRSVLILGIAHAAQWVTANPTLRRVAICSNAGQLLEPAIKHCGWIAVGVAVLQVAYAILSPTESKATPPDPTPPEPCAQTTSPVPGDTSAASMVVVASPRAETAAKLSAVMATIPQPAGSEAPRTEPSWTAAAAEQPPAPRRQRRPPNSTPPGSNADPPASAPPSSSDNPCRTAAAATNLAAVGSLLSTIIRCVVPAVMNNNPQAIVQMAWCIIGMALAFAGQGAILAWQNAQWLWLVALVILVALMRWSFVGHVRFMLDVIVGAAAISPIVTLVSINYEVQALLPESDNSVQLLMLVGSFAIVAGMVDNLEIPWWKTAKWLKPVFVAILRIAAVTGITWATAENFVTTVWRDAPLSFPDAVAYLWLHHEKQVIMILRALLQAAGVWCADRLLENRAVIGHRFVVPAGRQMLSGLADAWHNGLTSFLMAIGLMASQARAAYQDVNSCVPGKLVAFVLLLCREAPLLLTSHAAWKAHVPWICISCGTLAWVDFTVVLFKWNKLGFDSTAGRLYAVTRFGAVVKIGSVLSKAAEAAKKVKGAFIHVVMKPFRRACNK